MEYGTRLDHTIANVHILKEALENNIKAKIVNENNEIQLINKKTIIKKDDKYKYISIIPLTTEVTGVSLKGMKYSLNIEGNSFGDPIEVVLGDKVLLGTILLYIITMVVLLYII